LEFIALSELRTHQAEFEKFIMEHIIKKQNNIVPGRLPEELEQIVRVCKLAVRDLGWHSS
jgi:hypothetical protein